MGKFSFINNDEKCEAQFKRNDEFRKKAKNQLSKNFIDEIIGINPKYASDIAKGIELAGTAFDLSPNGAMSDVIVEYLRQKTV